MVVFYDEIPAKLFDFIERQPLFFVATAPLSAQHRVNLSPKSATGCFELVGPHKLRYLDLTGSGNETISHLNEAGNGRITVMFVNLEEGAPNIVRMYGRGEYPPFLPMSASVAGSLARWLTQSSVWAAVHRHGARAFL